MRVNIEDLDRYVENKLLRKAECGDLLQYNYTEYCNNSGLWDDVTLFNRGNIYDRQGNLVAKSMPKFMNLGQHPEEDIKKFLSKGCFEVTEKMDGCLGIIYKYKDEIRCNSRGGFDNYVTDKIKELLPKYDLRVLDDYVLIVEVISKETRIICPYDKEDLYLITAYKGDEEVDSSNLFFISGISKMPKAEQRFMSWNDLLEWQKTADWTKEGFVVRFDNKINGSYERVKVKSDDYMRIVKLRTNLNKHTMWKLMKNDAEQNTCVLDSYMENVPDELAKLAKQYYDEILDALYMERKKCFELYEDTKHIETRDLAKYFDENPSQYRSAIYQIRSNKNVDKILIKLVEPETGFDMEDFPLK